jgi:hypothetical protein
MMPWSLFTCSIALFSLSTLAACSATPDATNGTATATATADATTAPTPTPTTAATTAPSAAASTTPRAGGIWETETLGGVRVGMTMSEVEAVLGKAEKTTPPSEEGATGDWASSWTYTSKKISVSFAGPKKDGPHHARSVYTEGGSKLKTGAGIAAGSTKAEVEKAYGKDIDKTSSNDQEIAVGPDHWNSMKIRLEKGLVTSISIGSDGE